MILSVLLLVMRLKKDISAIYILYTKYYHYHDSKFELLIGFGTVISSLIPFEYEAYATPRPVITLIKVQIDRPHKKFTATLNMAHIKVFYNG